MSHNKLSSARIILMGQLMVNLPVLAVIIITVLILKQVGLSWNFGVLLSYVVGWYVWGRLIEKWKHWALNKGVERERLYKLGMLGLLNFYKHRIFND